MEEREIGQRDKGRGEESDGDEGGRGRKKKKRTSLDGGWWLDSSMDG